MDLAHILINPYLALYVLLVLATQVLVGLRRKRRHRRMALTSARRGEGAGPPTEPLEKARREALIDATVLLLTVFGLPFLIKWLPGIDWDQKQGLAVAFAVLLVWCLITGTDVARAYLGGLAFLTAIAFQRPFQVGDRVTLRGTSGRVLDIGPLFVRLRTVDDDMVSIPTAGLWSEVLTSANAGERNSMTVIDVYLAPDTSPPDLASAEALLAQAVQGSAYFDPDHPVRVFWKQEPFALHLTARAYVRATYDDALFVSDATRRFLDAACERRIRLAAPPFAHRALAQAA